MNLNAITQNNIYNGLNDQCFGRSYTKEAIKYNNPATEPNIMYI